MNQETNAKPDNSLAIDFSAHPLVPAVISDVTTGDVLMIGFMNEAAYRATRKTGRTHFWSRSRNKLWKKGETSGHEQIVQRMAVNCELNALLITVEQIGAVCHTGHPSCFYRDIEDDESLTITMDRWFDPDVVYGNKPDASRLWFEAFEWLKGQPLSNVSTTSRLLNDASFNFSTRVADELLELAGVLDGSHRHQGLADDTLLEGSQSQYWLALVAVSRGIDWETLRPDRALDTSDAGVSVETAARLLRAASGAWAASTDAHATTEGIHETLSLVAQAARSAGIEPLALIEYDLKQLQGKDYLSDYFRSR